MKVILRADIEKLGRLGDIVTIRPGYGRNYLLPQGLASLATPGNLKVFEQERQKLQAKNDAIKAEAAGLAGQIEAAQVVIQVRVGEGDKLYGSVTSLQIAQVLAEQGVEVDRRKIQLDDGLRALGEHILDVKLHPEIVAQLTVQVVKHGQNQDLDPSPAPEPEQDMESSETEEDAIQEVPAE